MAQLLAVKHDSAEVTGAEQAKRDSAVQKVEAADAAREAADEACARAEAALAHTRSDIEALSIELMALKKSTTGSGAGDLTYDDLVNERRQLLAERDGLLAKFASAETAAAEAAAAAAAAVAKLTGELKHSNTKRRQLHNALMELKGNVRVFCRVRPFLENDGVDLSMDAPPPPSPVHVENDGASLTLTDPEDKSVARGFVFDRVFKMSSSQDTVFDDVADLVQSSLDGYSVCLFA